VDKATAEAVNERYAEVVVAPEFEDGVLNIFARKKNLRVMRIADMARLSGYVGQRFVEFKSLIDGGQIVQWSFVPETRSPAQFLPATCDYKGKTYAVNRPPTAQEAADLVFGWLVEAGISSNSVIYVKDECTVGIGTGEQDRVGVAEIARDKAYRKLADRLCWERRKVPYNNLTDETARREIWAEVEAKKGGLIGSRMVSDAFFPFRDGIEVGLREGVSAVIQPGGSERDFESIEACNEVGAAMVFTGQRSFKH
jgi:phosphoribosylaminoimidazolecarboxamide formyltransferase/IMP cyclohydrolase